MRTNFRLLFVFILIFICEYSHSQNDQLCIIKYDTSFVIEPNNLTKTKEEILKEKKQVSVFFCEGFNSDVVKINLNGKSLFSSKTLTTDKISGLAGYFNIKKNKLKGKANFSFQIKKYDLCTFNLSDKIKYIYVNLVDRNLIEIKLSIKKYTFE